MRRESYGPPLALETGQRVTPTYLHTTSRDLLHPDQTLIEILLVEGHHRVNDHLGEEWFLRVDEFRGHGRPRALEEEFPEFPTPDVSNSVTTKGLRWDVLGITLIDRHTNLLQLLHRQIPSLPQALDDRVYSDTFLDVRPNFLQDLGGEEGDRGRAVSDFGILGAGNVDERSGGGMDDIEELE